MGLAYQLDAAWIHGEQRSRDVEDSKEWLDVVQCQSPRYKKESDGDQLTGTQIIWLGIFQYCFIRVFMTLVAVVTEAAGLYCLESLHPAFAHVWVSGRILLLATAIPHINADSIS